IHTTTLTTPSPPPLLRTTAGTTTTAAALPAAAAAVARPWVGRSHGAVCRQTTHVVAALSDDGTATTAAPCGVGLWRRNPSGCLAVLNCLTPPLWRRPSRLRPPQPPQPHHGGVGLVIKDLKAQLEGNLKVATRSSIKTKVLAPGMYAIDVKLIPHPLKNNRSAVSKHMSGKIRSRLRNFCGGEKVHQDGNNHVGAIMGYGDYMIGDSVVSRAYYVEGLGHNLFSVGQFCDSDLEVAFRKHSCFVRNMDGVDLLKGWRSTNLYTISVDEMLRSSPICLLSKASKKKYMAPVRISSGPEPIMMTPGQLNSGLAPSPVPATTYIPPTDKDLEILFQPMFDEYFDQSTDSEPVPTATVVNAPIVSTNTSIFLTTDCSKDALLQIAGLKLCKMKFRIDRLKVLGELVPRSRLSNGYWLSSGFTKKLDEYRALTASADVPSSVTETIDTTSTLPPPPPLQKPTGHRDIWEKVKDQKSRMHH
ncbi:hypothetical protein Tco_0287146, partial [Tanacetum coccineum]